ncbi:MAG: hypothetical protein CL678_15725 [Bdellovibrionaceae bacterium]|nr:hypothetical protein [Pseudobdellovibrionaceae bacterium]
MKAEPPAPRALAGTAPCGTTAWRRWWHRRRAKYSAGLLKRVTKNKKPDRKAKQPAVGTLERRYPRWLLGRGEVGNKHRPKGAQLGFDVKDNGRRRGGQKTHILRHHGDGAADGDVAGIENRHVGRRRLCAAVGNDGAFKPGRAATSPADYYRHVVGDRDVRNGKFGRRRLVGQYARRHRAAAGDLAVGPADHERAVDHNAGRNCQPLVLLDRPAGGGKLDHAVPGGERTPRVGNVVNAGTRARLRRGGAQHALDRVRAIRGTAHLGRRCNREHRAEKKVHHHRLSTFHSTVGSYIGGWDGTAIQTQIKK